MGMDRAVRARGSAKHHVDVVADDVGPDLPAGRVRGPVGPRETGNATLVGPLPSVTLLGVPSTSST